ncbi:AraC family transcriptional regulator, partial [Mycobacterium tuberculosis]
MNQLLSTDAVPRDQRLAYWTDMICNVYVQLGCDPAREG